jgi:hypothetical protein
MERPRKPSDIARRSAERMASQSRAALDAFHRETYALERDAARAKAHDLLQRFPKAAYMTEIESWRELPDGRIEFTMRRLHSAD